MGIPEPFELRHYGLTFFPGTDLHRKAKEDHVVTDDHRDVYRVAYHSLRIDYTNLMFIFLSEKMPKPVLRLLGVRNVARAFARPELKPAVRAAYRVYCRLRVRERVHRLLPPAGPRRREFPGPPGRGSED